MAKDVGSYYRNCFAIGQICIVLNGQILNKYSCHTVYKIDIHPAKTKFQQLVAVGYLFFGKLLFAKKVHLIQIKNALGWSPIVEKTVNSF